MPRTIKTGGRGTRVRGAARKPLLESSESTIVLIPRERDLVDGRFRIEKLLGQGGFGRVYRAYDMELGRPVALKFLDPALLGSAEAVERFDREAMQTAGLDHHNIVKLYEKITTRYGNALVLEYIEGRLLRHILVETEGDVPRAVSLAAQIASALAAAHGHARKIIHRDIKPENIMVTNDDVIKVMDFGIAFARRDQDKLTAPGTIIGTRMYMAPEQLIEGEASEHSDLFSFGCVFYELLTGNHPFAAATRDEVVRRIRSGKHDPVPQDLGSLTKLLEELLAFDRRNRPRSAKDVVRRLREWQSGAGPAADASTKPILPAPPSLSAPVPIETRHAAQAADLGIRATYASRGQFDRDIQIPHMIGSLVSGRVRVVGKTLLVLLRQANFIKALKNGTSIELAIIDPRAGSQNLAKVQNVQLPDFVQVFRDVAYLVETIKREAPLGSLQLRFHGHPLFESFTDIRSPEVNLAVWDLSFGRTESDKRIFVIDPESIFGRDLAARYGEIWDDASRNVFFHWDGEKRQVVVDLPNRIKTLNRNPTKLFVRPRTSSRKMPTRKTLARLKSKESLKVHVAAATRGDVAWIADLERRFFGRRAVPRDVLAEWYKWNSSGFFVFRDGYDKRIGFMTMLPLSDTAHRRFVRGELTTAEIAPEDLYTLEERREVRHVYVQSLVLDKEPGATWLWLRQVLRDIHRLFSTICHPERLQQVLALARSERGAILLDDLGFTVKTPAKERRDRTDLYGIHPVKLFMQLPALVAAPTRETPRDRPV
jgi:serine/threonine protein kinase